MAQKVKSKFTSDLPIDADLLSSEEKRDIEAQAEEFLVKEQKQATRDAVLKDAIAKARRRRLPQEEMVKVTVDLPEPHSHLLIDGTFYFLGKEYTVPRSRFAVIAEQMSRAWKHQAELEGKPTNYYFKQKNLSLNAKAFEPA